MKRRISYMTLVSLIGFLIVARALHAQPEEKGKKAEPASSILSLTIDYGDGAQKRYPEIPCKKSMTVLDALEWADKHPRGINFKHRGNGETTMLTQIDDLKNNGSSEKNWIFRVNGKLGDRSCGVFPVKQGDTILWRFEKYQ